jgi:fructose-1,6-bisphosphatase class II
MKSLYLDMVRVTEAGAIAAASYVGMGDKLAADAAATKAIRHRLNNIHFAGKIVIGEGIKDEAPGLFEGENVGLLTKDRYDIAVDPIEGTTPTSKGGYEAMSVIALAGKDCLLSTDEFYMKKIAYGPKVARKVTIDLTEDCEQILQKVSSALNKPLSKLNVCLLDRPRHYGIINTLRSLECRIKLIQDCDVTACVATCMPDSGVDLYLGIGGSPEGVISAAAMKCLGGVIQAQLVKKDGTPISDRLYEVEDLAKGDVIFSATGITDGKLFKGVRYTSSGIVTNSLTMNSASGTVRNIETIHGN